MTFEPGDRTAVRWLAVSRPVPVAKKGTERLPGPPSAQLPTVMDSEPDRQTFERWLAVSRPGPASALLPTLMDSEPDRRTFERWLPPSRPVPVAEKGTERFPAAASSLVRSLAMLAEAKTR